MSPHPQGPIAVRATPPPGKVADVGILNIFEPGESAPIHFPSTGFSAREATVGEKKVNFAEYLGEHGIDTRMPLVANYAGAMINTNFQQVDKEKGDVTFYAPVFEGMEYRLARPVDDYVGRFGERLPKDLGGEVLFSCNCILNYLHSQMEGRKTASFVGPITFGEIAYQLVNQTLAYLVVMDAAVT